MEEVSFNFFMEFLGNESTYLHYLHEYVSARTTDSEIYNIISSYIMYMNTHGQIVWVDFQMAWDFRTHLL